jgi:DNA-binding MarR family transcriptional regulator
MPIPASDSPRTSDIAQDLLTATHALARLAFSRDRRFAPRSHFEILRRLDAVGATRIGALARLCRITQPGTSRTVVELERLGWVRRTTSTDDGRASVVEITFKGRGALTDWRAEIRASIEHLFDDLTDDEWHDIAKVSRLISRIRSEVTTRPHHESMREV